MSKIIQKIFKNSYYDIEIHNDYKNMIELLDDIFGTIDLREQVMFLGNTKIFLMLVSFIFTGVHRCLFSIDNPKDQFI